MIHTEAVVSSRAGLPALVFASCGLAVLGGVFVTEAGSTTQEAETWPAFRGVFLQQLRDDHIVYERRIYDFTGLLIRLGVLKVKPT